MGRCDNEPRALVLRTWAFIIASRDAPIPALIVIYILAHRSLAHTLTLGSSMLRSRLSSRFMVVAVLPVPVLLPPSRWLLRSRSRSRSCCSSRSRARSTRARVGLSRIEGARDGGRELFAAFVWSCWSCCWSWWCCCCCCWWSVSSVALLLEEVEPGVGVADDEELVMVAVDVVDADVVCMSMVVVSLGSLGLAVT